MIAGLAALALLLCYASTLRGMFDQWWNDEDMSHGFAVPLVVAWIVWRERARWLNLPVSPTWWGFLFLAAAAAMELIHTFSLVHDDLPAMDNDDLRRGRPTNHKVYGEAMAILAGDAMTTLAFEVIANDAEPIAVPALVRELAHAAGPAGMIGVQVLDMDGENRALSLTELQRIHRMKTGALLTASCRLGAIAANADEYALAAMTDFGRHLGLAFQIIDDVLDVTSTTEQMGKATNKDASKGKNTYPVLLGLEASRAEAKKQLAAALDSLKPLGPASDRLNTLARFVVERDA